MTEEYWLDYFEKQQHDPMRKNVVGQTLYEIHETDKKKIHYLEKYTWCKSDNPFIKQIKRSPNITVGTVAELICRGVACELQYCMSLQQIAVENPRRGIEYLSSDAD
jgi:hypothetical protein